MGYRFTEGQIIGFRREAKAEVLIKELFRQHSISDTKRLKELGKLCTSKRHAV